MKAYEPSDAYKQAKEAFKTMKKTGVKPISMMPPPPVGVVGPISSDLLTALEEQNKVLRAMLDEQAAKVDAQAKVPCHTVDAPTMPCGTPIARVLHAPIRPPNTPTQYIHSPLALTW